MRPALRLLACALPLLTGIAAHAADESWTRPLVDGFDGSDFAPEGGLYYRDNAEQRAGRYRFQSETKLSGAGALELSVRSRCAASDDKCSERAEIWEKTPLRAPYDRAIWYGFSMKLAAPIPQDDHRYLMAQWKREIGPDAEGDFSPFLALRLDRGKMFFTLETNYVPGGPQPQEGRPGACPAGSTPIWFRPELNQMRAVVAWGEDWADEDRNNFPGCSDQIKLVRRAPLPRATSDWIDFSVLTDPDPEGNGRVEIFADRVWIASVTGRIGHGDAGLGRNQYFKFGPYRAAAPDPWTIYYDNFRRSPDCRDVLGKAALCDELR